MGAVYARPGRSPSRTTTRDPLMRQIFDEQDRLGVTSARLARMSGVSKRRIDALRHPSSRGGKRVMIDDAQALAESLDFEWPVRLRKRED